jgi:hypothetical protein
VLLKTISGKLNQPQLSEKSISLIRILIEGLLKHEEWWFDKGQYEGLISYFPIISNSSRKVRPTTDNVPKKVAKQTAKKKVILVKMTKQEYELAWKEGQFEALPSKVLDDWQFQFWLDQLMR